MQGNWIELLLAIIGVFLIVLEFSGLGDAVERVFFVLRTSIRLIGFTIGITVASPFLLMMGMYEVVQNAFSYIWEMALQIMSGEDRFHSENFSAFASELGLVVIGLAGAAAMFELSDLVVGVVIVFYGVSYALYVVDRLGGKRGTRGMLGLIVSLAALGFAVFDGGVGIPLSS